MTRLTTLAALYALGRTRLVTLLRVVSLLLAVPAGMWVDALLRAVTSAVTFFGTVDTLDGRCHRDVLRLLFLAVLERVSSVTTSRVDLE